LVVLKTYPGIDHPPSNECNLEWAGWSSPGLADNARCQGPESGRPAPSRDEGTPECLHDRATHCCPSRAATVRQPARM
jgi:hypothetical protein